MRCRTLISFWFGCFVMLLLGVQTNWSSLRTSWNWSRRTFTFRPFIALCVLLCVFSYEDHSEEKSPAASTDKDAKKDKWATAVPPRFENQTTDRGLVSFFFFFFFFPLNGNGRMRVPFCRGLAKRWHHLHRFLVGRSASIDSPEKAAVTRIVKHYGHCVTASLCVYRL